MWETWRERMRHWTAQRRAAREQEVLAYPPLVLLLLLLVGSRCKPGEHNAVVHDDSGQLVHTAHLGDGIMQVLSTASGAVWTGYFDEGLRERGSEHPWSGSFRPRPVTAVAVPRGGRARSAVDR